MLTPFWDVTQAKTSTGLGDKTVGWIGRIGSGKQSHYIALKAGVYCLSTAEHGVGQGPPPNGGGAG